MHDVVGMIATTSFLIAALITVRRKNWILCFAFLCTSLSMALSYFPPIAYLPTWIINTVACISFGLSILLLNLSVKKRQPSNLEIDRWNKLRARGVRCFVLIYGGFFGVLIFVPIYIGLFSTHEAGAMNYPITVPNMIITAILSLIGGVSYGLGFWSMLETRYKNTLTK